MEDDFEKLSKDDIINRIRKEVEVKRDLKTYYGHLGNQLQELLNLHSEALNRELEMIFEDDLSISQVVHAREVLEGKTESYLQDMIDRKENLGVEGEGVLVNLLDKEIDRMER